MDDMVEFGGLDKPRRLRLDMNAVCDFEDATGKTIFDAFDGGRMSFGLARTLLWAALKHEDRRLSRERVGQLLEQYLEGGGTLAEVAEATAEAINRSRLFSALKVNAGGGAGPNGKGEAEAPSPTSGDGSPSA
jgi:hypothetical protein